MTTMQKKHLIKILTVFGALAYGITAIVFAAIGEPWHWVAIGMMSLVALPIAVAMVYIPIAGAVWHWRLMGACITDEDEELLSGWWFYINRSESWAEYLRDEIAECKEDEWREGAEDLLNRLEKVKKPRWL